MKILIKILFITSCHLASCGRPTELTTSFSTKDLKNVIRTCLKNDLYQQILKYERITEFNVVTNNTMRDTVAIGSIIGYINLPKKKGYSLYTFHATLDSQVKGKYSVIITTEQKTDPSRTQLESTFYFKYKNGKWELEAQPKTVIVD